MGILAKSVEVFDGWLDSKLQKATQTNSSAAYERRGLVEIEYGAEQQWGWKEKRGLVGPNVLKNMARKDSVVYSIIQTRMNQVAQFAQPQKDKYSPGFKITPAEPAELSREDKIKLADPDLDDDSYAALKYEMDTKLSKLQEEQDKDIKDLQDFILHCGIDPYETDTTYKRCDFDRCVRLWVYDRLVYNYTATELVPNKLRSGLHHWYPVSAGTIRYVSRRSAGQLRPAIMEVLDQKKNRVMKDGENQDQIVPYDKDSSKPFRYVQVVRGRVEAAWSEDELIYLAGNPTVDPEDNGYAGGELEAMIQIVTAHLYAEAHNRNFFTQGLGTKGILHIKGENISRAQLEGFKRQWFNQLSSSRNAFRPPVIGMADEVKWVELSQSNKDMEFDNWMHYLIRIACAAFQIDPSEINFDISKVQTSTLNEANNEQRLKQSRDKGLRPLLDYIENILNRHILPAWNKEKAKKYQFKFVGLDAETRQQEAERLDKETTVWKTVNEARVEQGLAPLDDHDIIRDANVNQYLQMKMQTEEQEMMALQGGQDEEAMANAEEEGDEDMGDYEKRLDDITKEVDQELNEEKKNSEKESKKDEAKKANPSVIEYYYED